MKKQRICPFCGKELNQYDGKHIYTCKQRNISLSKEQLKLKYLQFNYGENILDEVCNDYLNLYSLPMLKEKYNIDYDSIFFLLSLKNIPKRTISESAKKISQEKYKKSCFEKYGVANVSQLKEIQKKKEETFTKHYGVDNIWKLQDYNKKCAELHPESHEEHMKKLHNGCQKFWDNLTEEGLLEWTSKVSKGRELHFRYHSSLETRFCSILESLNMSFTRQYHINKNRHPYDFHLCDSKIIIEINGNFWHANPLYYKEDDIIKYPGGKKKAKEIWERDKKFIDWAETNGYKVLIIWEDEFKKTDEDLIELFLKMLNSV